MKNYSKWYLIDLLAIYKVEWTCYFSFQVRIDMIGSACETAEKVIADCRKSYGLGSRQGTNLVPTLDKAQAAKIQEQEGLLRAAVNYGEGERHNALPMLIKNTI